MTPQVLAAAGTLMGLGWGLAAGLGHLRQLREFELTVARFAVLPRRLTRPFAQAAVAALLLGSLLLLIPVGALALAGGALLSATYLLFAAGAVAAWWQQRQAMVRISCGCVGGYLAADLTALTWTLPAGIGLAVLLGVLTGGIGVGSLRLASAPYGAALAVSLSVLLVLVVEAASTAHRHDLWVRFREVPQV